MYVIGSAIGNGLGNTYESLTITCDNTTILTTSYNTSWSALNGLLDGESILYDSANGYGDVSSRWMRGTVNGTPGTTKRPDAQNNPPPQEHTTNTTTTPPTVTNTTNNSTTNSGTTNGTVMNNTITNSTNATNPSNQSNQSNQLNQSNTSNQSNISNQTNTSTAQNPLNQTTGNQTLNQTAVNSTEQNNNWSTTNNRNGNGNSRFACNSTFNVVFLTKNAVAGDKLSFKIIGTSYTSYELTAKSGSSAPQELLIAYGDNGDGPEQTAIIPAELDAAQLRLSATMDDCGKKQRLVKYITLAELHKKEKNESDKQQKGTSPNLTRTMPEHSERDDSDDKNGTAAQEMTQETAFIKEKNSKIVTIKTNEPIALTEAANTTTTGITGTGNAVLNNGTTRINTDADMVRWVALFGSATIITSTILFFKLHKEKK